MLVRLWLESQVDNSTTEYSIFFEGNIKIFVTNSVGVCFQTGIQLNEILSEFSPISEIVQSLS